MVGLIRTAGLSSFVMSSLVMMIAPAAFAEVEIPNRKPGLWEIQVAGGQMTAPAIQQCTDETTDKDLRSNFGPMSKNACDKQDIQKTATGYVIDATCSIGGGTATSHTEISGDFNSAYTIKISSSHPAVAGVAAGDHTVVMNATWKGPCAADQKAGDIIMPGGIKMNIKDMQKMRALLPGLLQKQAPKQ